MNVGDTLTIPRLVGTEGYTLQAATIIDIQHHYRTWGWQTHIFVRFDNGDRETYIEQDLIRLIASVESE
jgi:hypothetical protein